MSTCRVEKYDVEQNTIHWYLQCISCNFI